MATVVEERTSWLARAERLAPFVGNTPLFPIERVCHKEGVAIYAKLEWQQMANSVKARPAFNMMKEALRHGELAEGKHLIDATSGNTGVAYATFGAALGIPVTLCVPENISNQKRLTLEALGVNLIFTSKFESTDGAQEKALDLVNRYPEVYYYPDQYGNDANWQAHYSSTANEIIEATDQKVTHFTAGLGTTGTFIGTARGLKQFSPAIQSIAIQPETAMHGLEGWKHLETAKIPRFYDPSVADKTITVGTEETYEMVKQVANSEGLVISPSSAANLLGAVRLAENIDEGVIVTVFPDHGNNYPEVMKDIFQ